MTRMTAAKMPRPISRRLFQPRADNVGVAVFIAALLFFFISSADAHAQSDWWDVLSKTPERLIGLLDLPDVVQGGCGPAPTRAMARIFAAPSQTALSIGTLYWREERDTWCGLMMEKADGAKETIP